MQDLFLDLSFPKKDCLFTKSSIEFFTNVQIAKNGSETRVILSDLGRSKFFLNQTILKKEKVSEIYNFFRLTKGRGLSFRFCDELDCKAQNEQLLFISSNLYQLSKIYNHNDLSLTQNRVERYIKKPIIGTVQLSYNNNLLIEKVDYNINYHNGEVSILNQNIDAGIIQDSFDFDLEVRFGSDELLIEKDRFANFYIRDLNLIEVL